MHSTPNRAARVTDLAVSSPGRHMLPGMYIAHHPELARRYGSDCAYCVGFSHDLPVRLREEAFTAAFIDGWRYECVWETTTRQDAELIVKVFREVCQKSIPGSSELVFMPLTCIIRVMDAIVDKARSCKSIVVSCVTRYPDSTDLPLSSPATQLYNDPLRCASATASSPPCSSIIPLERDVYRFRVLVEEVGDQLTEYVESNAGRWHHGGEIDGENSLGGGSSSSRFCNSFATLAPPCAESNPNGNISPTNPQPPLSESTESDVAPAARAQIDELQQQLTSARSELQDLKIKHQTLLETPTTQIKTAASAEDAAESKMAIAAAHELYLSEARAAADARSEAASKAADLDLALSAAETLQQRLLEMQARLQDSEARARQMEQGGQIYTLSRSPSTERCRHEISPSALAQHDPALNARSPSESRARSSDRPSNPRLGNASAKRPSGTSSARPVFK